MATTSLCCLGSSIQVYTTPKWGRAWLIWNGSGLMMIEEWMRGNNHRWEGSRWVTGSKVGFYICDWVVGIYIGWRAFVVRNYMDGWVYCWNLGSLVTVMVGWLTGWLAGTSRCQVSWDGWMDVVVGEQLVGLAEQIECVRSYEWLLFSTPTKTCLYMW